MARMSTDWQVQGKVVWPRSRQWLLSSCPGTSSLSVWGWLRPAWVSCVGGKAPSRHALLAVAPAACAPLPASCSLPCPLEQSPPSLPRQAVAGPPTSARRSGRLLVPRPQSPFDPLLGSEPCDPVGGPRLSSVQRSPTFSCWGESLLFVLQPRTAGSGGLQVVRLPGGPPMAVAVGRGASPPPGQGLRPQDTQSPWERGGGELGLHTGTRFLVAEWKKRALCGHSYLFVNIWPRRRVVKFSCWECLGTGFPPRGFPAFQGAGGNGISHCFSPVARHSLSALRVGGSQGL